MNLYANKLLKSYNVQSDAIMIKSNYLKGMRERKRTWIVLSGPSCGPGFVPVLFQVGSVIG